MRNSSILVLAAALQALQAQPLQAQPLAGTKPLTRTGDITMEMVASIDRYLTQRLDTSAARRHGGTRDELKRLTGIVDQRVAFEAPWRESKAGQGPGFDIYAVRWPALDGMDGEGLLLEPRAESSCRVIAIPDADDTPESLVFGGKFPARIAASGCQVLVPMLIDRADTLSGHPAVRYTNQPHREFIHRMSYEMGRHIIGYEVQKVLAAVDWMSRGGAKVGVYGYGEGGLLALMSAAVDIRISATVVSGYFNKRENVIWSEPIYRNIWSQLELWGDGELAKMVKPRWLMVEASRHPVVTGPPPERQGRRGAAPGKIVTPSIEVVRAEATKAGVPVVEEGGALAPFLQELGVQLADIGTVTGSFQASGRLERQFRQMVDYTQKLMRESDFRRRTQFFATLDTTTLEKFKPSIEPFRKYFWEEVQGRMPAATEPLSGVESRKAYDRPKWTGYEVVIPVWGEIYAYGILLVPKDIKPGERRPVVVAQHGLEGRPQDVVEAKDERTKSIYADFASAMADQGYIVFAPQNPYIGQDVFRVLMRKGNPVKLSLFSFIIGQHSRILDWLETLPYVDKSKMGFYGLSYGGKTAMRVPAIETRYALSICSGDFNEWVWKVTSSEAPFSYMFTGEYDMLEFNLGHTFNYFEQAMLIAPRPFMVERGHRDGVGIDEWVAMEFAKVRRFYTFLGIGDRAEIEYFNGPHQIHGVGTYAFLDKWLRR